MIDINKNRTDFIDRLKTNNEEISNIAFVLIEQYVS